MVHAATLVRGGPGVPSASTLAPAEEAHVAATAVVGTLSTARRLLNPAGATAEQRPPVRTTLDPQEWVRAGWEIWIEDNAAASWIFIKRRALAPDRSAHYFAVSQQDVPWFRPLSAKQQPLNRETAWMTEPPCSCRYECGGLRVPPHPFPKWMQDLWAEEIVVHLPPVEGGLAANSANLNKYCGGSDACGWHADDERLFDSTRNPATFISLSLGCSRKFQVKPKVGGPTRTVTLEIAVTSLECTVSSRLVTCIVFHRSQKPRKMRIVSTSLGGGSGTILLGTSVPTPPLD